MTRYPGLRVKRKLATDRFKTIPGFSEIMTDLRDGKRKTHSTSGMGLRRRRKEGHLL